MSTSKMIMSQAANQYVAPTYIEDVFSTYLYTGNGSTQTITNGIDLAGEGGLVWIKDRSAAFNHAAHDTEQGATKYLTPNDTDAAFTTSGFSFNSDGFTVGSLANDNRSGDTFASWTFRKAPRFFDVVTWTGDGTSNRAIPHNLGGAVGSYFVKCTSDAFDWLVWHKDLGANNYNLVLNTTAAVANFNLFSTTAPDSSNVYLGTSYLDYYNASGRTYVAYLFAHDPLGPSGDGSDGLIACGSFLADNYSNGPEINLGWEPQWLLVKNATNGAVGWAMFDNMRGWTVDGVVQELRPNTSAAEASQTGYYKILPTGFVGGNAGSGGSTNTFIYIAIRRGPMRAPTSGTEVFLPTTGVSGGTKVVSGFPVDMQLLKDGRTSVGSIRAVSRLTGVDTTSDNSDFQQAKFLLTATTDVEASSGTITNAWDNTGFKVAPAYGTATMHWSFHRAPGFFDAVAYTGDSVAGRTVPHNLGVAPEMMIVKNRTSDGGWLTYAEPRGISKYLFLNQTSAETDVSVGYDFFFSTSPTATDFTVNSGFGVNGSGNTYIAYLFATLPGVSKVGSYTGTGQGGGNITVDCGFTSGARFVLIKRTDASGNWWVADTARGIVSGNDPLLALNDTSAEVTNYNMVEPSASGFIVNGSGVGSDNSWNAVGGNYIFLAIA